MRLSISQKLGATLAVSLALLFSLGLASLGASRRAGEAARWVQHTQDVESDLSDLSASISGMESASRGFVLTGDPRYLAPYDGAPVLVREQLRELRRKTADNPAQQRHLDRLAPLVDRKIAWLSGMTSTARERGAPEAVALLRTGRGREIMASLRAEIIAMNREEERLLEIRNRNQQTTATRTREFIMLTIGMGFVFLAAAGIVIERDLVGRRRAENALRNLSMVDELTGLANRRGFFLHAEDRVRIADRISGAEVLYFADLDGLKAINDALGHAEGDRAIVAGATALREAFPSPDIVARLGGDEFVALALLSANESPERRVERLRKRVDAWNAAERRPFRLAMSVGIVPVTAGAVLDDLLAAADRKMYQEKRERRATRRTGDVPAEA